MCEYSDFFLQNVVNKVALELGDNYSVWSAKEDSNGNVQSIVNVKKNGVMEVWGFSLSDVADSFEGGVMFRKMILQTKLF